MNVSETEFDYATVDATAIVSSFRGRSSRDQGPRVEPLADRTSTHFPTPVELALIKASAVAADDATAVDQPPASAEDLAEPSDSDRRAYPRRDSGNEVLILRQFETRPGERINWSLGTRLRGRVVDVSLDSIGFVVPIQLDPGEKLLLRVVNHNFDKAIEVGAIVLRATALGTEGWRTICRFSQKLDYDQVQYLGRQRFSSRLV